MAVPLVISAYKNLAAAQKIINIEIEKENALNVVKTSLRNADIANMTREQIIEEAQIILKEKNVTLSNAEVATKLEKIGLLKAEIAAETADVAAKEAENVATTELTLKQNALNASLMANPLM